MDQDPTAEERAAIEKAMPETVKEPGLPENVSQLRQKLGQKAKQEPSIGHCACLRREFSGEPDAGNLHIRFDEGGRKPQPLAGSSSRTLPVLKGFLNRAREQAVLEF